MKVDVAGIGIMAAHAVREMLSTSKTGRVIFVDMQLIIA